MGRGILLDEGLSLRMRVVVHAQHDGKSRPVSKVSERISGNKYLPYVVRGEETQEEAVLWQLNVVGES